VRLVDVHDLLTYIAVLDNRRFGEETVLAWHGIIGHLDIDDCREAVRRHFASTTEYLMPAHIVRLVGEIDRERRRAAREAAEAAQARALAATPRRDRSPEVAALIRQLRATLRPTDPSVVRRPEVLAWDRARQRKLRAVPGRQPSEVENQPDLTREETTR